MNHEIAHCDGVAFISNERSICPMRAKCYRYAAFLDLKNVPNHEQHTFLSATTCCTEGNDRFWPINKKGGEE